MLRLQSINQLTLHITNKPTSCTHAPEFLNDATVFGVKDQNFPQGVGRVHVP